ncbi:uncharacterized protein DNG_05425 [Cephalotrichum gorgonifer]|uniref:Large ribosomal subunit protein mL67 n=1 Tax=Cephalotrichum gorgonifer TaxID=2041049 RepID=A0AAE8MYA9_9PEZI|nr:uncharacterized protein DNG_05425 [Cephalotrichum gorgonifer]
MSAVTLARPATVDQLAIGISRISVRHGHWKPRYRKPQPELTGYPEGHGEKIWVFNELRSKLVVYSHTPVLDVYKAHQQIPFVGKKSKPSKIRKDLWRQLAMVEFPAGRGDVGQSVYAKLREFRRRHELEWDDSLYFEQTPKGGKRVLTRQERGKKVLEQKANAVADLAAVLAGSGKSNKVVEGEGGELCEATIYWANAIDRHYATKWSPNVKHGLLPDGVDWSAPVGSVPRAVTHTLLPESAAAEPLKQ